MKHLPRFLSALIVAAFMLNTSCKKEVPDSKQDLGNITISQTVEISSTSIEATGGNITVSKPGTPLDGMKIVIPANSFPSGETFTVSYAEISSHKFGANFNPISPMITIACDGGYAAQLMQVTVPVKIPEGHVAIGFYLDEATGKLEGVPFESVTSNSITLLTRHFLSGNMLGNSASSLKSTSTETNKGAKFIITSFSESVLNMKPMISSGFKPGVDDWEFVNDGSYLSPKGQCAGQSIAAMWYFFEKKPAEGSLFNKYSDNANLWQDNARGYRFCSVLQSELGQDNFTNGILRNYIRYNQSVDLLKFYAIVGTMLVTGEPCYISIAYQDGTDASGNPVYAGHALVCYQIAPNEGKLYISDPNIPGTGQSIELVNGKFKPYQAKINGHAASSSFPFISFLAKSAMIDWSNIENRYAQLVDNTIGNQAPSAFPAYTIWSKGKVVAEVTEGFSTDRDTLRCMVECPTADLIFNAEGKQLIRFHVFNQRGQSISNWEGNGKGYVLLKPGLNKLGFYVVARKTAAVDADGNPVDLFIDFKWINVYYSKLEISPNPIACTPGTEAEITAKSFGTAPKDVKYIWSFGDGTADVTKLNDSIVKHQFSKAGEYAVVVKQYDNSTGKMVGTANAQAKINLSFTSFSVWVSVRCTYKMVRGEQVFYSDSTAFTLNTPYLPCTQTGNIISATWNGTYSGIPCKGTATFTLESDNTVSFTVYNEESQFNLNTGSVKGSGVPIKSDNIFLREYRAPESHKVLQTAVFIMNYSDGSAKKSTGMTGTHLNEDEVVWIRFKY